MDEICTECGARNPRGMFCPMSDDGEEPHRIRKVAPPVSIKPCPSGFMPGDAPEDF